MKKLLFQTDLHCGGCIRKIEAGLNQLPGMDRWEVDLAHEHRLLSVWGDKIDPQAVQVVLESCGFEAKAEKP
ncbi:MAG: heavy-metal-associated domain-containing protein [Sphingomonadales bacterium]|nr:heavy-metal-associated domain-containing protein [Sphingomonadales bacterium]